MQKHKILSDEVGASLIEVMAASAISIIIAMGVMQINDNATKGMAKIQGDAALQDVQKRLRGILTDRAQCTEFIGGTNVLDIATDNSSITSIETTQPGAGTPTEWVTVGQRFDEAPEFVVTDIVVSAYDNDGNRNTPTSANVAGVLSGNCNLRIGLINSKLADVTDLTRRKYLIIPMLCKVDNHNPATPTMVESCATTSRAEDDGHFVLNDATGEITFTGSGVGTARTVIGDITTGIVTPTATLSLSPAEGAGGNQLWPGDAVVDVSHALALPFNAGITFGDNDDIGIYNDEANVNRLRIYGDAATTLLVGTTTSGTLIGTTTVTTSDYYGNNYLYSSDEKFKKNIQTLTDISEKLSELRGVTYFMRQEEFKGRNFSDKKQIGLIAQEVEAIFPELVSPLPIGADGIEYKSVKYANFVAILIEAFKEQKIEIEQNRELIAIMQFGMSVKDSEQDLRIESLEIENSRMKRIILELSERVDALERAN